MPGIAKAGHFSVQPRLEVGIMTYSFESEKISETLLTEPVLFNNGFNFSQEAFEYKDNLSFVGIGGTFFFKRFFLDLSGQYAFDGHDSETAAFSSYGVVSYDEENQYMNTAYLSAEPEYDVSFNRRELAVSLGYAIGSRTSLFAGYKWTSTYFDTTYEGTYSVVNYNSDSDLDGKSGGRVWGDAEFKFEYEGPFVGVVQGWKFSPFRWFKGVFTANLALAYLQGEVILEKQTGYMAATWKDDQQLPEVAVPFESGGIANRFDTEGDSLGLTLGIAWRGETAVDGLSYNIGVHGYRYEFDSQDNGQSAINETAVVYKLGMTYAF
jgi:hypothetical protein